MGIPPENLPGLGVASVAVGLPSLAVSVPMLFIRSTPERTHPVREMDILGIPDFFEHTGNCDNRYLASFVLVGAGIVVQKYVPDKLQAPAIIGTAVASAAGAVGVNAAYEAGVSIPTYEQKPDEASFDSGDALFGGVAGALFSIAYCTTALLQRRAMAKKRAGTP